MATRQGEPPAIEVVSTDGREPDDIDDWSDYEPQRRQGGRRLREHRPLPDLLPRRGLRLPLRLSRGRRARDTLGPTEFDDEVETGKVIEIAAGADLESAIAAVTPDEPKLGGVNEVLERLQAADAAAATGQPAPLRASKKRLGEILVDMQLVTAEQIDESLATPRDAQASRRAALRRQARLRSLDLTKALATKFGIEYLDLTTLQIDMSAAGLLSERLCRRYSAIPVRFLDDSTLQVAMIDPANVLIADDLRIMTGYTIVPAIASEEDIVGAIGKLNRLDDQVTAANDLSVGGEDEITDIREMTEEPPIVKLVNSVIAQSVDDAASDIHFEPQAKDL